MLGQHTPSKPTRQPDLYFAGDCLKHTSQCDSRSPFCLTPAAPNALLLRFPTAPTHSRTPLHQPRVPDSQNSHTHSYLPATLPV